MEKEKILVTGANGLLGQQLVSSLLQDFHPVIATGRGPARGGFSGNSSYRYYSLDLSQESGWLQVFTEEKPAVVIHAGAMTQADDCEWQREASLAINTRGTAMITSLAAQFSQFLIFLSTDFVFDGHKGNYSEEDPVHPVNWYGFTKVQAEAFVRQASLPWAILRTCLVYGSVVAGSRQNIISWVKSKLDANEKIRVVDDQLRTPTFLEDLVTGIRLVLEKRARGIYHISGKDMLSPYEMARITAAHCGLDADLIERVNAGNFSQPARRPLKTGFTIEKAASQLGFQPLGFQESLHRIFPPGSGLE